MKDEFTLRFLFFSKLAPGKVREYLCAQREKTLQQKEGFERTLASLRGEMDYYLQAIIRKGILHLEAEVRWLDEVTGELEKRC